MIAANRSIDPHVSTHLPGPDEGAVPAKSTEVEGTADHVVLPVTHTFPRNIFFVTAQVVTFPDAARVDHALTHGDPLRWSGMR